MHYASPGGFYSASPDETFLDSGSPKDEYQASYISPSYGVAQASYKEPSTVYVPGIRRSRFIAEQQN